MIALQIDYIREIMSKRGEVEEEDEFGLFDESVDIADNGINYKYEGIKSQ